MDPIIHTLAAIALVGSVTAAIALAIRALNRWLDQLAYRRTVRRRMRRYCAGASR